MRCSRVCSRSKVKNSIAGSVEHMSQTQRKARLQDEIDQNLKRAYQDVLNEDVPDRFTQLLDQLRAQDNSGNKKGSAK